jgi:hypothetical protein
LSHPLFVAPSLVAPRFWSRAASTCMHCPIRLLCCLRFLCP